MKKYTIFLFLVIGYIYFFSNTNKNITPNYNISFEKIIYLLADRIESKNTNNTKSFNEESFTFNLANEKNIIQLKCDLNYQDIDINIYCNSDFDINNSLKALGIDKKLGSYNELSDYIKNSLIETLSSRKISEIAFEFYNNKLESELYKVDALRNTYLSLDSYFSTLANFAKFEENNFSFYQFTLKYYKFICNVKVKLPEAIDNDVFYKKDFILLSNQENSIKNMNNNIDKYKIINNKLLSYKDNINKINSKYNQNRKLDTKEEVSMLDFMSVDDFFSDNLNLIRDNIYLNDYYNEVTKVEDSYNLLLKKMKVAGIDYDYNNDFTNLLNLLAKIEASLDVLGMKLMEDSNNLSKKLENSVILYNKSVIDNEILDELAKKYWVDIYIESNCLAN
jgi:hypothetical protein